MGINFILEKLARDGWQVIIYPRNNEQKCFYAQAEKDGKQIAVCDECSPANTIKMLHERIYDENAG